MGEMADYYTDYTELVEEPIGNGEPPSRVWHKARWVSVFGRRIHIREILQQETYWLDSNGKFHELRFMQSSHQQNLLNWMFRHAKAWRPRWLFWVPPKEWLSQQPLVQALSSLIHEDWHVRHP